MSTYSIIYDWGDEMYSGRMTADELSDRLNNEGSPLHGYKILEDFPNACTNSSTMYNNWPVNSIIILRDGAIYVPRKVTIEVVKQVEIWEVE